MLKFREKYGFRRVAAGLILPAALFATAACEADVDDDDPDTVVEDDDPETVVEDDDTTTEEPTEETS